MTTYYHGTIDRAEIHEGLCVTEWDDVAEAYARRYAAHQGAPVVAEIAIDMAGLSVVGVDGYDHDANSCAADCADYRAQMVAAGADILRYEDEDETGRTSTCFRLVSGRALAAASIVAHTHLED